MSPSRCAMVPVVGPTLRLRRGHEVLEAALPAGWDAAAVRSPRAAVGLDEAAIAAALQRAGLAAAAGGARRVTVLAPDATRRARSDLYLPPLVEQLRAAGAREVTVVLATGTHPAPGGADRAALLGAAASADVAVVQHDCHDDAALCAVAPGRPEGPFLLARAAVEADLLVLTGRVTNHYFAGYTGGAKALLPGVAGYATVLRNHRRVLDDAGGLDPRTRNGRFADNPVRLEMEEAAAALANRTFLVNTVVDAEGRVAELCAGDLAPAHAAARAAADAACRVPVPDPCDVVVASCGGAPFDGSLVQALKTVADWAPAVRPGGVLVWVAAPGAGQLPQFRRWLAIPDLPALRAAAVRDYDLRAHNTVILRTVQARCRVVLVSTLPAATVAELGFEAAPDLAAALARARDAVGGGARCLVVPEGNDTYADGPEGPW